MPALGKVLAISSGKGGVGKSTVSANLAAALARDGHRVGLMDADIYGPNIPRMFGLSDKPEVQGGKIQPLEAHGVKLMSLGFIVERDAPAIWRGPIIMKIIGQFLRDVAWGELDYFLVDLPPGTGDAQLSLTQIVRLHGAIIVTTPQEMAVGDSLRGAKMFERVGISVVGIVENMSYFVCPHCHEHSEIFLAGGGSRLAAELGVPLLGQIPLQAGGYIGWASAIDSTDFALQRIDSLLGAAMGRARAAGAPADFWLATALGYRARQREEHGHGYSAARDAKAMRDIYRRLLAADSSCADCDLGLGVYDYGLARAGARARFFARIIGLGTGNAERGIRYMRRAAHDGELSHVEATWVLAAALIREAVRDRSA